jgi:AAA-like domain
VRRHAPSPGPTRDLQIRLAARFLDPDGILELTRSTAWAWFQLPTISYEFLTEEQRDQLAIATMVGLGGIRDTDCHLLVVHRDYPVDRWTHDLHASVPQPAPGWLAYLGDQQHRVATNAFWSKEVWFGVCLGRRRGGLLGSLPDWAYELLRRGEDIAGLTDDVVSPGELEGWRDRARAVARSLAQGPLDARPATCDDLAWLVQRSCHRALPPPPPTVAPPRTWGPGQLQRLVQGRIENGYHYLTIVQPTGTSYVASLGMSHFLDDMTFPDVEPWIYYAEQLDFPVEFSIRAHFASPRQAAKDTERQLARASDQAAHMQEANRPPGLRLQRQLEVAEQLSDDLVEQGIPFLYDRDRLVVSAGDPDTLIARVAAVIDHYRQIFIDVQWPTGDQFALFREAMPGDRVRLRSYLQYRPLITLAGGLPTASAELGEPVSKDPERHVGPYIGMTTGRSRTAVHFDVLTAARINEPAAVGLVGSLGGGKTTTATAALTYPAILRGAATIYLDPKGDARGLHEFLSQRTEQHPNGRAPSRILDLAGERPGLLDPFSLSPQIETCKLLALDVLFLLLPPGLSEERRTAVYQAVDAVTRVQAAGGEPASLRRVVDWLRQTGERGNTAALGLATELDVTAQLPFAQLLFAAGDGSLRHAPPGLTVIALAGLTFPDPATPREHYSVDERLGVAVFHAVAKKARQLLDNLDHQWRLLVIDEAWMLTSTSQGRKLIQEAARKGRSRRMPMLLVSQLANDLMGQEVTNCLSAVFAFKSTASEEVDDVLKLLRVENTPQHQAEIRGLGNGECVLLDLDSRVGKVKVDIGDGELRRTLERYTNAAASWHATQTAGLPLAAGGEDLPARLQALPDA